MKPPSRRELVQARESTDGATMQERERSGHGEHDRARHDEHAAHAGDEPRARPEQQEEEARAGDVARDSDARSHQGYMIRPNQSIDISAASTANSAAAAAKSAVISLCFCSNTSRELSDS